MQIKNPFFPRPLHNKFIQTGQSFLCALPHPLGFSIVPKYMYIKEKIMKEKGQNNIYIFSLMSSFKISRSYECSER